MKIEIMGGRCANCARFTQYYCYRSDIMLSAIDCGYCSKKAENVRAGDKCKEYQEKSNASFVGICKKGSGGEEHLERR